MIRRNLIFICILGTMLAILVPMFTPSKGEGDFVAYWSVARLLSQCQNPYDHELMLNLQQTTSPERFPAEGRGFYVWNPPWLMLLMLPLGLLPYRFAVSAWIFCSIAMIGIALLLSWQMLYPIAGKKDPVRTERGMLAVLVVGYSFGQVHALIAMGQVTGLVLLGFVLGIWLLQCKRDGLAGMAFLMVTIKPHLTYLLLLVLFIWVMRTRRWRVFGGLAVTGLSSVLIVWSISPTWPAAYFNLLSRLPHAGTYTSTVGSFVMAISGFGWLRFAGLLLLPLAFPLARRTTADNWLSAANLALLLSVPLAPYGFGFDQVVLLPAIVQIIALIWSRSLPTGVTWLITTGLMFTYLLLLSMLTIENLPYFMSFWVPLALLGFYVLAWKTKRAMEQCTIENGCV
jgi:hypothetical protein